MANHPSFLIEGDAVYTAAPSSAFIAAANIDSTLVGDSTEPGELDADPAIARWTPVVMEFDVPGGFNVSVVAKIGASAGIWLVAYDEKLGDVGGDGLAVLFSTRSTVEMTGNVIAGRHMKLTILPNGGWQRPEVTLVPYLTREVT